MKMISSKRELKKLINHIGNDIAEIILPSAVLTGAITDEQADEVLAKVAVLKAEAHKRMAISYDKVPADFADGKAFRKARHEYFKEAFTKAFDDFSKGVAEALKPVNEALTKKA